MLYEVSKQGALLCGAVRTVVAGVGFLSCVDPDVGLEVAVMGTAVIAIGARVRLLPSMFIQVPLEVASIGGGVGAIGTLVDPGQKKAHTHSPLTHSFWPHLQRNARNTTTFLTSRQVASST